jgi:hypothetical protein
MPFFARLRKWKPATIRDALAASGSEEPEAEAEAADEPADDAKKAA